MVCVVEHTALLKELKIYLDVTTLQCVKHAVQGAEAFIQFRLPLFQGLNRLPAPFFTY